MKRTQWTRRKKIRIEERHPPLKSLKQQEEPKELSKLYVHWKDPMIFDFLPCTEGFDWRVKMEHHSMKKMIPKEREEKREKEEKSSGREKRGKKERGAEKDVWWTRDFGTWNCQLFRREDDDIKGIKKRPSSSTDAFCGREHQKHQWKRGREHFSAVDREEILEGFLLVFFRASSSPQFFTGERIKDKRMKSIHSLQFSFYLLCHHRLLLFMVSVLYTNSIKFFSFGHIFMLSMLKSSLFSRILPFLFFQRRKRLDSQTQMTFEKRAVEAMKV